MIIMWNVVKFRFGSKLRSLSTMETVKSVSLVNCSTTSRQPSQLLQTYSQICKLKMHVYVLPQFVLGYFPELAIEVLCSLTYSGICVSVSF